MQLRISDVIAILLALKLPAIANLSRGRPSENPPVGGWVELLGPLRLSQCLAPLVCYSEPLRIHARQLMLQKTCFGQASIHSQGARGRVTFGDALQISTFSHRSLPDGMTETTFQDRCLNRSAILPSVQRQSLSRSKIKEATQVRRVGAGTTGGASL